MEPKIAVIGGGSWGTALAILMAEKGYPVSVWVYEPDLVSTINRTRENSLYLPGIQLPGRVTATGSFEEALTSSDLVLFVAPSHVARSVLRQMIPILDPQIPLVIATKGIETSTLMLMSEVVADESSTDSPTKLAAISGPSFAKEVCSGQPTALDLASQDDEVRVKVEKILSTSFLKLVPSKDLTGVQLGGALKNIYAIATGIGDGLGWGHNTRAAIISYGLAEMERLGLALGADAKTFSGLSGLGDLVLTCTGDQSRNRSVGLALGQGKGLKAITSEMKMVAEGIKTTQATYRLANKKGVTMPIVNAMHAILFEDQDARNSMIRAMASPPEP